MESSDRDRIKKTMELDHELKRLYEEHLYLEDQLSKFYHRGFLTSDEEIEEKQLKVRKLRGVDQMMAIVNKPLGRTSRTA